MDRQLMLDRAAENIAAWNRGDAEGAARHLAEDVIWHDIALPMPLRGRDAVQMTAQGYMTAFPDLHFEVTSQTAEGNRLVQEWLATGTHRGDLMGIAATGKSTRSFGATVATFADDGTVLEATVYWNALAMMQQLGVTPDAAPAQPVVPTS